MPHGTTSVFGGVVTMFACCCFASGGRLVLITFLSVWVAAIVTYCSCMCFWGVGGRFSCFFFLHFAVSLAWDGSVENTIRGDE